MDRQQQVPGRQPRRPLGKLLGSARRVAVVGLSDKPWRASQGVARYLQSAGYRIYPVNPNITDALGELAHPALERLPDQVDIVNVFRRSEYVAELVEPAIRSGAKLFWMQQGVRDAKAARRLEEAGVTVIEDRCLMVEHMRMFSEGGLEGR